ncbi:MAG: hypothetical protein LBH87_03605 [Coriobacteriales bacterium]|jgi:hypothetical protein|nr:hypothetical protein [Coriobacteriales bacterium]
MSRSRRIACNLIAVLVIAALIAAVLIPWDKVLNPVPKPEPPTKEQTLRGQQQDIQDAFGDNQQFYSSISFTDSVDEDGNPYCVGVLDEKTDALVAELVNAYNADPETIKPITEEEARYSLTDGIVQACSNEMKNSPFREFLGWCSESANLVYKETYYDENGNPFCVSGEKVIGSTITNYKFVMGSSDVFYNYTFSWLAPNPGNP